MRYTPAAPSSVWAGQRQSRAPVKSCAPGVARLDRYVVTPSALSIGRSRSGPTVRRRGLRTRQPRTFWSLLLGSIGATGWVIATILDLVVPLADPTSAATAPVPGYPREVRQMRAELIEAPFPDSYVVAEGDTLFDIATALGSSVEALILANALDDLDLLQVGQELVVPPPGSARQPTDPALSLAEIAAQYRLEAGVLAAYNAIASEQVDGPIERDALLFPPGATPLGLASWTPSPGDSLLVSIPFGAERPLEPLVYRVRPGDTLTDVAWRVGIDVDTILNNNRDLGTGDYIRIGDELLILPISGLLYQVQEGDTLATIAARFGLDEDPILEVNALASAGDISGGMELILPGAGPVYAPAPLSGVDRIAVPYRSQLDGTPWAGANCGPTSLGMGLEALGIKVSSTELRRQVLNAQGMWGNNVGTLMDALARVASSNGAQPVGLYDGNRIAKWSLQDIRDQLKAGRPVIVQVRFRALPGRGAVPYYGDHYIILTGVSGANFLYNDPLNSDGPGANRMMTPAQLERAMDASDRRYAYAAFALSR